MTLSRQASSRSAAKENNDQEDAILELRGLKTYFFLERGVVKAVDGVNASIGRKKTLGVVGESGCGKSVTFRSVMRLIQSPPGRIVEGEILLHRKDGDTVDIVKLDPRSRQLRDIRGAEIARSSGADDLAQSLHPVGRQISESILLHQNLSAGSLERARSAEQSSHR